ncbi:TIM barrel protein [Garciella nitratireducens]|uniref:TIM barrel protein n=1 Tax=Garciella nitratireducens TaxID=218205 RepID=UPI000DEBF1E7|nr:TIM barrel protein [Garciella nitratireducens]RBP46670.1 endonuclease IV [Garciella nitratireducens]
MNIKFGPSGNSESFYEEGYKSSLNMPKWLKEKGLSAYEYSCTKGVRIKEITARKIGEEAKKNNIFLSIHAPYYINLANPDRQKRENSKKYIMDTLLAAEWMEAKRVVFHPGSVGKLERQKAFKIAMDTFEEVINYVYKKPLKDIVLCPETMGKRNQLGTLKEVLELCKLDNKIVPTIDFGHLHARNGGSLKEKKDFQEIIDKIEEQIGQERAKKIHIHFSRIEFTKAGEKKHWTYADYQFGPNFDPLAEVLVEKNMTPVIICESRGTMAEDALIFKKIYEETYFRQKLEKCAIK